MAQITLHNFGETFEAKEVNELSDTDAIKKAKQFKAEGKIFTGALVDRTDGLVLFSEKENWHFRTALCGYDGNGPDATVLILEMFGFGDAGTISSKVKKEGSDAKASFFR